MVQIGMHSSDPLISTLIERVHRFIERHDLLCGVKHVYVGFSGGPDSTALLLILRAIAPNTDLTAVHLHHGLRASADADAEWCAEFCRQRGIPFETHRLHVRPRQGCRTVEQAARSARLEFWRRHLVKSGSAAALGHTADDAIETFILRLLRGANTSGLYALRPRRVVEGVTLIRPILCLHRNEVLAYLESAGVTDWRQDETNDDPDYTLRNRIRKVWLPEIQRAAGTVTGLFRTMEAIAADARFLEEAAGLQASHLRTPQDLADLPDALLPRVLRTWISRQVDHDAVLSHAAIERIREAVRTTSGRKHRIPLGRGLTLVLAPDELRIETDAVDRIPALVSGWELEWDWRRRPRLNLPGGGCLLASTGGPALVEQARRAGPDAEVFRADQMPAVVKLRGRRPGDRIVPFGRRTPKKLKDIFIDRKTPLERRDAVPIVEADGVIVWAAGVCRAEFARVTAPDQRCVLFCFRHGPHGFGRRKGAASGGGAGGKPNCGDKPGSGAGLPEGPGPNPGGR